MGLTRFRTTSDDGSTIRILDGSGNPLNFNNSGTTQSYMNNDYHQGSTTRSGTVSLTAGQTYTIEIRYWENQGAEYTVGQFHASGWFCPEPVGQQLYRWDGHGGE